jgi:isopenicillin-N epimerase
MRLSRRQLVAGLGVGVAQAFPRAAHGATHPSPLTPVAVPAGPDPVDIGRDERFWESVARQFG